MTTIAEMYTQQMNTSQQMVLAASRQDWGALEDLESQTRRRWARIRQLESQHPPTAAQRKSRHAALLALLRLDAQIRSLVEPEWTTLAPCFPSQVSD